MPDEYRGRVANWGTRNSGFQKQACRHVMPVSCYANQDQGRCPVRFFPVVYTEPYAVRLIQDGDDRVTPEIFSQNQRRIVGGTRLEIIGQLNSVWKRRIEILVPCKSLRSCLLSQGGQHQERYYNPAKDPKPIS